MKLPARVLIASVCSGFLISSALLLCTADAMAQSNQRAPSIGYVYPAGGERGTSVEIVIGGQNLRNVSRVCVTGEGVHAKLVRYMGRFRRLNGGERRELKRRLDALKQPAGRAPREGVTRREEVRKKGEGKKAAEKIELPNHPLFNELEALSPWEIEFVENLYLRSNRKNQPNAQIAETALIEVSIDASALPGDREIRIETSIGMTNPLCFQIDQIPERREHDPYDAGTPPGDALDVPFVMNGQIKPGDTDRFPFRAREGQELVITTSARHLIPFLADAVPGWFQATLTLFDASGKEMAFTDDYRFSPDPVLCFDVPATGIYEIEIRDSIYRGREDFVYRVSVDERPFITSLFPLGGRAGEKTTASVEGWNLRRKELALDTRPGGSSVRHVVMHHDDQLSNALFYSVGNLPECTESEPNSSRPKAQRVALPCIVNGRIASPGDVDLFCVNGGRGNELVVEVQARRLRSPIDSVVKLFDSSGKVVAWNDDYEYKDGFLHTDMGPLTHHADSYLRVRLPKNGKYFVEISDSRNHGGSAYAYRLRLSRPRPDFELHVTPSSLSLRSGRATPIGIYALRRDGFDGAIEVRLKDAPPGFGLQGGLIPEGTDQIRATLSAPPRPIGEPVALQLEGLAAVGKKTVSHVAIPADNKMQAFLYRHLVPSQELLVTVTGSRVRFPPPELAADGPLRISKGKTARVRFTIPKQAKFESMELELNDPPAGVSLADWTVQAGNVDIVIKADAESAKLGMAGNLIIEIIALREGRTGKDGKKRPKQRIPFGVLPAIPFEIVKR